MKKKQKVSRGSVIKGNLFILLGIIGILFYAYLSYNDFYTGRGGFFITIISVFLIYEGYVIRKGKKSVLFELPI